MIIYNMSTHMTILNLILMYVPMAIMRVKWHLRERLVEICVLGRN